MSNFVPRYRRTIPEAGELKHPVSLIRASRLPDKGTGFNLKVTPYANVWAKRDPGAGFWKDTENNDKQWAITDYFYLRRNSSFRPESRDYLVFRERMMRVLATYELEDPQNPTSEWWIVMCYDEGPVAGFTIDNTTTEENPHDDATTPESEPEPARPEFPLWS